MFFQEYLDDKFPLLTVLKSVKLVSVHPAGSPASATPHPATVAIDSSKGGSSSWLVRFLPSFGVILFILALVFAYRYRKYLLEKIVGEKRKNGNNSYGNVNYATRYDGEASAGQHLAL